MKNINQLINYKADAKTTLDIAHGGFYKWLRMQRNRYMPKASLSDFINGIRLA